MSASSVKTVARQPKSFTYWLSAGACLWFVYVKHLFFYTDLSVHEDLGLGSGGCAFVLFKELNFGHLW